MWIMIIFVDSEVKLEILASTKRELNLHPSKHIPHFAAELTLVVLCELMEHILRPLRMLLVAVTPLSVCHIETTFDRALRDKTFHPRH